MTSTTLTKTLSTVLNASGSGLITLKPDVGQNWAPLFVRVSTSNRKTPVAYCAVYHGSPGVPVQQSQFIDDTFLGSGDTSSIIAGTPILYGEAILFSFSGGTPGDTAIASVYGMNSDLPPNLDLSPQVPGTHFTGHLATETINVVELGSFPNMGPLNSQTGLVIDVRQYASYNLQSNFAFLSGAGGVADPVYVQVSWFSDSSGSGSSRVYRDAAEFWCFTAPNQFGSMFMQDAMHGPYMQIQVFNESTTDHIQGAYTLTASTRPLSQPYFRQEQAPTTPGGTGIDGIIISTGPIAIGAASTVTVLCPFTYGRVEQIIGCNGPADTDVSITYGSVGSAGDGFTVAAGTTDRRELIVPKRPIRYDMTGAGGAASNFSICTVTQFDKV